jgi:hypothetical protein
METKHHKITNEKKEIRIKHGYRNFRKILDDFWEMELAVRVFSNPTLYYCENIGWFVCYGKQAGYTLGPTEYEIGNLYFRASSGSRSISWTYASYRECRQELLRQKKIHGTGGR